MRVTCARLARHAAGRPRAVVLDLQPARHASRYSSPRSSRNAFDSPSATAAVDLSSESQLHPAADPYDKAPEGPAELRRRLRRLRYASYGLFASVIGTAVVGFFLLDSIGAEEARQRRLTQLDAPGNKLAETFHGRPVHVIGSGEDGRIVAGGAVETDLVRTGTSSVPFFPKTMSLPTVASPGSAPRTPGAGEEEEYTLLGLGVRTVTFFGIEVYVLGLYVRTGDLSALQARLTHTVNGAASTLVPGETAALRAALLDPDRSAELWTRLLAEDGLKTAWRVSPTKNTDFAHLRDGWVTAIRRGTDAAAQLARSNKVEGVDMSTDYDSEAFGEAVRAFKDVFTGQGRTAKGSVVTLVRDERGGLGVWFEDPGRDKAEARSLERIGQVSDTRIGRLIWLGYLAGKNVSSEQARRGVVDGCVALASRPVGSAETMVA